MIDRKCKELLSQHLPYPTPQKTVGSEGQAARSPSPPHPQGRWTQQGSRGAVKGKKKSQKAFGLHVPLASCCCCSPCCFGPRSLRLCALLFLHTRWCCSSSHPFFCTCPFHPTTTHAFTTLHPSHHTHCYPHYISTNRSIYPHPHTHTHTVNPLPPLTQPHPHHLPPRAFFFRFSTMRKRRHTAAACEDDVWVAAPHEGGGSVPGRVLDDRHEPAGARERATMPRVA